MDEQEALVRRYGDAVYRLACAQTHSPSDADDVFQEVFLRYFRKARLFESEAHRKAWLLRVTINCARSFFSSPWQQRTETLDEDIPAADAADSGLSEAMATLPAKYRSVIHLHYFEGYSTEELAALLGRRASTVRTQLTRARRLLAEQLKGDENGL